MRTIAYWCFALLLLPMIALAQQGGYEQLENVQPTEPETVEVYEFFSYACPHCYTFRPAMERWSEQAPEKVRVVRVPVIFNKSWEPLAKAYYAADVLGAVDELHKPLFDAIHAENRRLRDEQDLIDFFVEQGLPREKVANAFASFAVDMKVRQAKQIARNYRIMSTPSVAVEGRYVINPNTAGNQERMLDVLDALVRQELAKQ